MNALLLPTLLIAATYSFSQTTTVPDINFEQFLIDTGLDSGSPDGMVLTADISGISELYVQNKNIADLSGIEDFTALEILRCDGNLLTTLDLSQNTALTWLLCSGNQLTGIDLTGCSNLYYLACSENNLTILDLSTNTSLAEINCGVNSITTIDVSNSPALTDLNCWQNNLTSLDVSGNLNLGDLNFAENQLTAIDLSQNPLLVKLNAASNLLTSLDISENPFVNSVICNDNNLQCLNVRNGYNEGFYDFIATGNSALTCIEVDDTALAADSWTAIDAGASFSELCGNACSSNQLTVTEQDQQSFDVYPNPVTGDVVYITTSELNLNYDLVSVTGEIIQSGVLDSKELSVVGVRPGIYLLRVSEQDGVRVAKIILN